MHVTEYEQAVVTYWFYKLWRPEHVFEIEEA